MLPRCLSNWNCLSDSTFRVLTVCPWNWLHHQWVSVWCHPSLPPVCWTNPVPCIKMPCTLQKKTTFTYMCWSLSTVLNVTDMFTLCMNLKVYQVDPETPHRYMMQSSRPSLSSWTNDPIKPSIALSPPPEPKSAMLGTSSCKVHSKQNVYCQIFLINNTTKERLQLKTGFVYM